MLLILCALKSGSLRLRQECMDTCNNYICGSWGLPSAFKYP